MGEPVLFGSYELLDRIAEGGMAEVWRARSRGVAGFEKTVVIKRVLPSLMVKPGFADLLIREAKIAARLSHPRIVQIFDLGEEKGSYFIAMEYVNGRDLGQAMSYRSGSHGDGLPLPLRVWIIAEAAGALDYAHRRRGEEGRPMQIVHRDISPQNILLGYEGEVKVADFGIARADEQGLGRGEDPKILRGKYAYMSPEQARGEPLDRRSDLFSLGIVLYELLTGKRLFRAKSSQETLAKVRGAEMPSFEPAELGVEAPLARAIARCLAPTKDDRYAWCGELYSELTQWLFQRGEPVGPFELAQAMERMFPPEDALSPNKLRVDLMIRAYQDASAASVAGVAAPSDLPSTGGERTDRTQALPTSRRLKVERRRIAYVLVADRAGLEQSLERACAGLSGVAFPPSDGLRAAAFGHAVGIERGAAHASRAALELRRLIALDEGRDEDAAPPIAVVAAEGKVVEGVPAVPDRDVIQRARAMLDGAGTGDVRIDADLEGELGRSFVLRAVGDARAMVIEDFRARTDRDASVQRRHSPMIGRRDEIRRLGELALEVASGGSRVVQIVGEPGSGKSRLIAELCAMLGARDIQVISARADESELEMSFSLFCDVVRSLCGIEDRDPPEERFAKVARLKVLNLNQHEVRRCGELIGLAYPIAEADRAGRPRGIEIAVAIRKAIHALAHDRPLVLVLEDLQWLDDGSRQLLPLLIKGLARPKVMVVATRRPGTTAPHFHGELMRLSPLPADLGGRLFAASLGAKAAEHDLCERVLAETAGNPEWIETLAAIARESISVEDGVARMTRPLPLSVPIDAQNTMTARLGQLSASERSLLLVIAAIEGEAPVDLISSVESLPTTTSAGDVRRLLARGMIAPAASASIDRDALEAVGRWGGERDSTLPKRVTIPGALFRRALLSTLDDGDLRRLHSRIVSTLERGDDRSALAMRRLGRHAAQSADPQRAVEYLTRSADLAVAAGDAIGAAQDLRLASEVARTESDDPEENVDLALRAARIATAHGALEHASSVLAELAAVHGAHGSGPTRLSIAMLRAEVGLHQDRAIDAIAYLREMEPWIEKADAPSRAAARLLLGRALLDASKVGDALVALRRAVEAHREAGDTAGRGQSLAIRALAEARADMVRESDDTAEEALALAARLGHPELRYAALVASGAAQEAAGDHAGAASRLREAAELALHAGLKAQVAQALLSAAIASFRAGESLDAAQRIEQALALGRRQRSDRIVTLGGALQSVIALEAHPDVSYLPALVRAVDKLEAADRFTDATLAVELLGRANQLLGDRSAAARTLRRGVELAQRAEWASMVRVLQERASSLES